MFHEVWELEAVVKVAWDAGGRRPSNIRWNVFPHVRYLNGRTGTVTGTRDTTQSHQ